MKKSEVAFIVAVAFILLKQSKRKRKSHSAWEHIRKNMSLWQPKCNLLYFTH